MSDNIDLSFLDNAPAAIMFVKIEKNENNEVTSFSYKYTNQKLKEVGIVVDCQVFEKTLIDVLNSENKEELKVCVKVATEGEDTLTDHYFSVSCWQPNPEYCGCIFKDITKERRAETNKTIEIENSNVILQNTAELLIDFDLRQLNIECLKEKRYIPVIDCTDLEGAIDLRPCTLAEGSIKKFVKMLDALTNYTMQVKGKLKIQTGNSDKYEWYEIRLCREGQRIVGCGRNINSSMLELERLQLQAERDSLTGILNHKAAERLIESNHIKEAGSMFLMDIDDFKTINDTHGHPNGDEVIKNMADILQYSFRQDDIIYRIGGDEFGVFAPGFCEYEEINERCKLLFSEIEGFGRRIPFSASVGVAINDPYMTSSYKKLYKRADEALYSAKHGGKGKAFIDIN